LGYGGLEAQDTSEIFEAEIVIYGDAAVGVTPAVQAAKMNGRYYYLRFGD